MKVKCLKCGSEFTSPIPLPADATCDECPTCKQVKEMIKNSEFSEFFTDV